MLALHFFLKPTEGRDIVSSSSVIKIWTGTPGIQEQSLNYLPGSRGKSGMANPLERWVSSSSILLWIRNNSADVLLDRMRVTAESSKAKRVVTKEKLWNASIADFRSMTLASFVIVFLQSSTSYSVIDTQHKEKSLHDMWQVHGPCRGWNYFFSILKKKLKELLVNPRSQLKYCEEGSLQERSCTGCPGNKAVIS